LIKFFFPADLLPQAKDPEGKGVIGTAPRPARAPVIDP